MDVVSVGSPATDPVLVVSETVPSFQRVFAEHGAFVWRVLRHLGVHERDLEDASQEVFVAVHRKLAEFEGRSSMKTWLYGISLRVASHVRERAHLHHETLTESPPEQSEPPTQHEALERSRDRALLARALDELNAPKRAVFVLHDIEDVPMSELVEALGCPLATAYSRLRAARKQVMDAVARMEAAGTPARSRT